MVAAAYGNDGEVITTRYADVRYSIQDGDVLLFRADPDGLIATEGRSVYSHAGLAAWRFSDQNTLFVAESREGKGGRLVTLSSQIRKYPGCIDVFRPSGTSDRIRQRAATIAANWSGKSYGYPTALRMALYKLPILRRLWQWYSGERFDPSDMKPSQWDEPKVCSQLVVWAYRMAQWEVANGAYRDLVPNLGDRWVEPADLARSAALKCIARGLVI